MNKVKELRTTKDMTQVQLAIKVGVTENAIQNYERGRREPSVSTAIKIAKVLETTVEDLFNETKEEERK